MAKSLPVNREEVKAFYIASGGSSIETSKEFNLPAATIRQWVRRYQWPSVTNSVKKIKEGQEELKSLEKGSGVEVTHVTAGEALQSLMERKKGETQTALAVAVSNASVAASELHPLDALESSRKLKDLADTMGKLWPTEQGAAQISVNVLGLSLDGFAPRPVIDL
jgi:transposase-like protein